MNEKVRHLYFALVFFIFNVVLPVNFNHEFVRLRASLIGMGMFSPSFNFDASKLRARRKIVIMS